MKVTVDTNVLVRATVCDDLKQAETAQKILKEASLIAISLSCLCEFVWVLRRVYRIENADICSTIRALLNTEKITMNRPAVEAGLAQLEAKGDFADSIIEHEGTWLGGETFISFDKKAVTLLIKQGKNAALLK
ncbi:type II toxin-antitoxin system VapC family toxin [Xenorhabdus bovienii]|uniref:Putative nucleic-acid-binding protein n=1 Tax=Xenorhabdus bovienii str. feltiae Moldova TaxID=1398200 RepID=A0A077NWK7_XENBV|nr:type II toxin-antitoxin system VapC family toxin [Xenorhabdus bovienii]CDH02803.1 putative nucleic-acid-binding protein [Xenorhabdus bovienii str. feltiae Moldova]